MNNENRDFWLGFMASQMNSAQERTKLLKKCRSANITAFCALTFCTFVYMNVKDQELRIRKLRKEIEELKGE